DRRDGESGYLGRSGQACKWLAANAAGNGCIHRTANHRGSAATWRNGDITMNTEVIDSISAMMSEGNAIPYLGPGVLALGEIGHQLPGSPAALVGHLTAKSSVPHKIRTNLTATAQFIENFKHRKTVNNAMTEAFRMEAQPTPLHTLFMNMPCLPLVVHAWYDDLPQKALRSRTGWGMAQGVSQAEHFGNWVNYFDADGTNAGVESSGHD